jgi:hypothetical protein
MTATTVPPLGVKYRLLPTPSSRARQMEGTLPAVHQGMWLSLRSAVNVPALCVDAQTWLCMRCGIPCVHPGWAIPDMLRIAAHMLITQTPPAHAVCLCRFSDCDGNPENGCETPLPPNTTGLDCNPEYGIYGVTCAAGYVDMLMFGCQAAAMNHSDAC